MPGAPEQEGSNKPSLDDKRIAYMIGILDVLSSLGFDKQDRETRVLELKDTNPAMIGALKCHYTVSGVKPPWLSSSAI
jgi:hypothetical protein